LTPTTPFLGRCLAVLATRIRQDLHRALSRLARILKTIDVHIHAFLELPELSLNTRLFLSQNLKRYRICVIARSTRVGLFD